MWQCIEAAYIFMVYYCIGMSSLLTSFDRGFLHGALLSEGDMYIIISDELCKLSSCVAQCR